MVRLLLDFNVVVLENPQQRTGKRGAHFGSVPHLFGNGSSRIDALLGLIGLADHRQRFSVSAQLKGVAGAPRLTVAVTARKLRTVDRKIAGIAHKGRSFHLLEDVERPVGQKLDVDIEIRICSLLHFVWRHSPTTPESMFFEPSSSFEQPAENRNKTAANRE